MSLPVGSNPVAAPIIPAANPVIDEEQKKAQAIAQATSALSQNGMDSVSTKWENSVVKASNIFYAFLGVFSTAAYALRCLVSSKDSALAKSGEQLAKIANNIVPSNTTNPAEIEFNKAQLELALNDYYLTFAKSVSKLGVNENSEAYGNYIAAAKNVMENTAKKVQDTLMKKGASLTANSKDVEQGKRAHYLHNSMKGVAVQFDATVAQGLVKSYASQSIASINGENFAAKTKQLNKFFSNTSEVEFAGAIRTAFQASHSDAAIVEKVAEEFADVSDSKKRAEAYKTEMKTTREAAQKTLEARLVALRGEKTDKVDTINKADLDKAWKARDAAQQANDKASNEVQVCLGPLLSTNDKAVMLGTFAVLMGQTVPTTIDGRAIINGVEAAVKPEELKAKLTTYFAASNALEKAIKDHEAVAKEFAELVTFDNNSNVVAGKLFTAREAAKEATIAAAAREKANTTARLLRELNTRVTLPTAAPVQTIVDVANARLLGIASPAA